MKMKSSMFLVAIVSVLDFNVLSQNNSTIYLPEYGRIVGGYTVSINKVPWIIQISYYGRYHCGGSIVSVSKILSAAHCTTGFNRKYLLIRAGSSKSLTGGQVREISKIINHPKYSSVTSANDISIIFLTKRLKLSPSVAVIKIANEGYALPNGSEVLAAGWGLICENCDVSKILQAVKLPIIGNDRCRKMYEGYAKILPTMLCAGRIQGGKDTCQGDSGGPLTFKKTLVGAVSFGIGCARAKLPGVYMRISSYSRWIRKYL